MLQVVTISHPSTCERLRAPEKCERCLVVSTSVLASFFRPHYQHEWKTCLARCSECRYKRRHIHCCRYCTWSWPSSPPHWLSQKRNGVHVKSPSLSYSINFVGLYRLGGLMVSMLAWVNTFSRVPVRFVFDSWCMYIFLWALTSLFYEFLVTFYFLLIFYFSLCSSLILLDIKSSGLIKIAIISH